MTDFKELMDKGAEHCKNGEFDEALKCYNKAIEINPYDDKLFSAIGKAYYGKKDYKKAAEFYERSIELNPSCHYRRYTWLGNSYHYLKDYSNAIKQYEKVIKINPTHYTAYSNMGNRIMD
ncbi:TPR Domain containing protein [Methanococcus maripaludis X1]|uniref:TPR Domain containing protein n=1 Tax=Methanococcus maripaludis X1 TaxID=1053692 RepID=G0H4T5_METMI|nr:tetratricopeptide repeat protein [Methanococcus maripaludis]AEK19716.1 TPR Domain containing protein [Methanococcus maripaludis X1]